MQLPDDSVSDSAETSNKTEGNLRGRTSALARGASLTLAARLVALFVGIGSSIIVARALGPAGKGQYALVILVLALFQMMGGLGLDQAVTYFVAKRRREARAVGFTLACFSALIGLLLIGVHFVISMMPFYSRLLERMAIEPGLVWILILLLPGALPAQTFTAATLGLERYREYNLATLIAPITNIMFLVPLVIILDLGVVGAVVSFGGSVLVGVAGAAAIFFTASSGSVRFDKRILGEAFGFGIRAHVAHLAWFLHYRADMFLIGYITGPAALGFYTTAANVAESLFMAPSAIGTVLFPRVAAGPDEARSITPIASRHALWLTLGLATVLALVAWPFIFVLYGQQFLPSVLLLWLLLPGVISLSVGRVLSADLNGRRMPGVVAKVNCSMAVLNLALNLWWIPIFGAAGAAAATSISYTAAVYLLGRRFCRVSGATWPELVWLTEEDREQLAKTVRMLLQRDRSPDKAGDRGA
jgi:O-antigen/teichoic acid export membrane protein